MKIVSKQIDEYKSLVCSGVIKEYIVYEMMDDDTKISAQTVIGDEAKQELIKDIIVKITLGDMKNNIETPITITEEKLNVSHGDTPLVLCFYIESEVLKNGEIAKEFVDSVNFYINDNNYNVMALFLPTNGVERVECINPTIASGEQIERINTLINDIENNFDINKMKGE